jgi:membrane protein DedA with SNARE-associated domain
VFARAKQPVTTNKAILRSKLVRRIAIAMLVVATLSALFFGFRSYGSFRLLQSAYEAGAPLTSSIRAWMTLSYVAAAYRTSDEVLIHQLGLPPETDPKTSLKSLADGAGVSRPIYVERVQRAIAAIKPHARSDHANETPSWFGSTGDQVLTALLVYGYPVLGLTLLLCAIGLPLPDGIATTVAGSLIAQGRMDWALAGSITVAASILGDGVGYSLGRLLSQEILERHGRWFAYTPARRARVQLLFNRWGSLTIFLTRTIVSYLAPVASLLAGVSRYRLSKFLAIALVGRVIWAATYLGFGYGLGSDWQAAANFLT